MSANIVPSDLDSSTPLSPQRARVVVETSPLRASTLGLRDAIWDWVRRSVPRGVFLGLSLVASAASLGPLDRALSVALWAIPGTITLFLFVNGVAAVNDILFAGRLADVYGLEIKPGLYTRQCRRIALDPMPAELRAILERVIANVASNAQISWRSANEMSVVLPRIGRNWMRCRVVVRICEEVFSQSAYVVVEARLEQFFGFNDLGRNIIIAEEFQRRLKTLVEQGALPDPYEWGTGN